ncbi:MAG TPA: trehalose-phosphatase [Gammaproteobacteria bacterium]
MPAANKPQSAHRLPYSANWALFLDIDGTLLEMAETPGKVVVTAQVRTLVHNLDRALSGACALISGRTLSDVDALFRIPRLSAAGLHGMEYRLDGNSTTYVQTVDESVMAGFRRKLSAYMDRHPGLLLEDKKFSLAVHFRQAPALQADVEKIVQAAIAGYDADFHIQNGKMLAEIKSRNADKGRVILYFMDQPRFHGRIPVFIGDDVTDEDGFRAVNHRGGISIKVGDGESDADWTLEQPGDVIAWLEDYLKFLLT